MKIHEKIKKLRKDLGYTPYTLAERILKDFGKEKALSARTIFRIEKGLIRDFKYIDILCLAFGVRLTEIMEGTDLDDSMLIKGSGRSNTYVHPGGLVTERIVSNPCADFKTIELDFEPGGSTVLEQDPIKNTIAPKKCVYIVRGRLTVRMNDAEICLKRKDALTFNSHIHHRFINQEKQKCLAVVNQFPKNY